MREKETNREHDPVKVKQETLRCRLKTRGQTPGQEEGTHRGMRQIGERGKHGNN